MRPFPCGAQNAAVIQISSNCRNSLARRKSIPRLRDPYLKARVCATFKRFFRADAAERGRKEVEHRVMSAEDAIESLAAKLKEARHLTEEASRKHDETIYKLDREDWQIQIPLT